MATADDPAGPEAPRPKRRGVFDARLRAALVSVALTGGTISLAAAVVGGLGAALSAALGATFALVNLWGLARIVVALLPADAESAESQSRAGWALVALLKMVALLSVAWLLMRHGVVSPIPMLIGFLSLPIGIAIGSLVSDRALSDDE